MIAIDGEGLVTCVDGLNLQGGNSTVKHLAVYGFCQTAIELDTQGNDTVESNFIGLHIDGVTVFRFGYGQGIFVNNISSNVIGGTSAGSGNVISGTYGPVLIYGAGATDNSVVGNLVGTDLTGTIALGNFGNIEISDAANNTVGGTIPSARNVIAGASTAGVRLLQNNAFTTGNVVEGNYIGTDITGTSALSNDVGVDIVRAMGNTIGGTVAGAGNLISGSNRAGIAIDGEASGNFIEGNRIGTNAAGTAAIHNLWGMYVTDSPGNFIGGSAAAAGNLISGNSEGVVLYSSGVGQGSSDSVVQGNLIGTDATGMVAIPNAGSGINIYNSINNRIGGTTPGARNVISGNTSGVAINMPNATGNSVLRAPRHSDRSPSQISRSL